MVCGARGRRRDERELVAELARVLDDPDDLPSPAVEGQGRTDFEPEEVGHAVGDGDLAGSGRVAAPAESEEHVSVGAAWILRAVVQRLDAAGTTTERWATTSIVPNARRAEASPASSLRGSEPSNLSTAIGRAELGSLPAGSALWTIVMLQIAAATATLRRVSTRSCCRHSRRNRRPAQRIIARRAATPPFLGRRSGSP